MVPAHGLLGCQRGRPPADSGAMSEQAEPKAETKAAADTQWAEAKKGCAGCLAVILGFIVLVALCSDDSPPPASRPGPPPQDPAVVSAAAWTDGEWPFTINQGTLVCFDPPLDAIYFVDPQGRLWPLNGTAYAQGERRGAEPDLASIWREDEGMVEMLLGPEYTPEDRADLERELGGSLPRINIGPLMDRAFQLCEG